MANVIEGVGTSLTVGAHTFCYVSLKGLSITAGDALDATCLSNSAWVTKLPPTLREVSDVTFTAHYAPEDFDAIDTETGANQELVISFAYQGTAIGTITFWGYLSSFDPEEGTVGSTWNGTGSIVVTNMTSAYVEQGPVWASA